MSGAGSTLIVVATLAVLSAWLLLVLRPWRHPQHAARYRPDLVEVAATTETVPYAEVEGPPPWSAAPYAPYVEPRAIRNCQEHNAAICIHEPMGLEEEATARAQHGELVFGDSRGWQSGGCLDEATLRRELALVDQLDLPGEDGPALPPAGPDGAGCESEGPGLTAPPAPVPWLERELGYLDDWARRMREEM